MTQGPHRTRGQWRTRQKADLRDLIWNVAETIEHLSAAWTLQPGDLIYTGTPAGVAAVVRGDLMEGRIAGLGALKVRVKG
jgi:fumarylpyruvate hydrolase